jgi:SRSO17 transposase
MTKPRTATPTVGFVDEYCALYQAVFPDVRSFEQFTFLQVGMLADLKRKTLPAIARAARVG